MEEHKKRSILKTLTWRVTASLDTFVIAWIIAGDWKMGEFYCWHRGYYQNVFLLFS